MGWISDAHKRLKNNLKSPKEVLKQVINPAASTFNIATGSNMLYDPLNLSGATTGDNIISDLQGTQPSRTPAPLTADSLRQAPYMGAVGQTTRQSSPGMMNQAGRPSWWPQPQQSAPSVSPAGMAAPTAQKPLAQASGYNQALINQLRARSANAMLPSAGGAMSAPPG